MTTIALLWVVGPLIASGHNALYHWSGRPATLFVPAILDFLLSWLVFTILIHSARPHGLWRKAVWLGILCFLPWVSLKSWALYEGVKPNHLLSVSLFMLALASSLLFLIFWRRSFNEPFEHAVSLASTVFGFLSITGAALLLQAAFAGWQAKATNAPPRLHQHSAAALGSGKKPRVIWIVFDELSYQQVYEQRFPTLQLPAFDALALQSTLFTHTVPAGFQTERVLPALLTGRAVDGIRSSPDGQLSVHHPDSDMWERFDQHDSVFQDALAKGYGTAAVGWYNPYCRLLPAVLDSCEWMFEAQAPNGLEPNASIAFNMLLPFRFVAEFGWPQVILHSIFGLPAFHSVDVRLHLNDYRLLTGASDKVLLDPSAGFVLLHLPIPHPLGIFDRSRGELTTGQSTYIDNVALADHYLAHIRRLLEESAQWDSSTLLIMGDHSWRLLWRTSGEWTNEEERASQGGTFDDRPAYIVKLANQQSGARIGEPFQALQTRKLLDEIFSHRINTKEDLAVWAKQAHD